MQLKRILIPLLAIIMVCLAAAAPLSAAEAAPSFDVALTTAVNGEAKDMLLAKPGDTFTVVASVVANPGVTSAEFTLLYNADALEVVEVDGQPSYTCYGDVFALDASKTAVWTKTAGQLVWRYLGDTKTTATGKLVEVTFKVKADFHGDFDFAIKSALALNGIEIVAADATVGYAGAHDVSGDPVVKEASCTEAASKTYHCTTCNKDVTVYFGEPTGHNLVKKDASEGSCTEDACLAHFYCAGCDGYFLDAAGTMPTTKDQVITKEAPGHTEKVVPGTPATCDTPGVTDRIYCSVCQEEIQAQDTIPATGHTVVIDPAVEPADGKPGKTEGRHCSTCGKVLVPQEVINPTSLVWLWVLIVVVVVAAAGVVAYFFIFKKRVKRY